MMKRTILLIALLATIFTFGNAGHSVQAQVIHIESFDDPSFPPVDWSRSGGFNSRWQRVTNGNNPPATPHSGAGMARFQIGGGPGSNGDQEVLISPVVDYSGASGSTPTVSLWMYRESSSTAGDSLTILVNTSPTVNGATRLGAIARSRFFVLPVNEPSDGWYNYSFNVPSSFNTDTNYILFNGTSRNGGNIYIDDVQWEEYITPCTGSFTAGNVLSSDSLLCGGSGSVQLTLDGTGLTGGGISFQWQSSPGASGPWTDFGSSSLIENSGNITDTTYFRCIVTCANASVSDTSGTTVVLVVQNPNPSVMLNIPSSVDICPGDPPVEIVASGAPNFLWTPNIAINTVGDSAMASPINTTVYTVVGYDTIGCADSTTFTINVGDAPIVNATVNIDTICPGDPVNLTAMIQAPPFGLNINWQPGGMNTPNVTVNPTVTTTYVVTVSQFFFDCDGIDSVTIYVEPGPLAGFTYSINNQTVTFTDTSIVSGSVTYTWDFGDGNSDNSQNPVHTYASNGIYTVSLTVSDGNCSNIFTQAVNIGGVGIEQLSDGSLIRVFPNPSQDIFNVQFTSKEERLNMVVRNSAGQEITREQLQPAAGISFSERLDLESFPDGIYYLQIFSDKENVSLMILKQ
jgi:PKD repeat protein